MRTTTRRKRSGPPPLPRLRINQPALYNAVRTCGTPGRRISRAVGFTDQSRFSILISAETIPATAINIQRLKRIAAIVGFDKSKLFLNDLAVAR